MANKYDNEINTIREKADIADIIGSYIPLNKLGKDYVGICPFHDDHSPSMHVNPQKGIFKCFVCNTGGTVFTFVQKYENVSYLQAVKIVADKSGINFDYQQNNSFASKFSKEFELMDLSLKYYQNNLASEKGLKAKKYLNDRGISDDIIKEYKFGLSFDDNGLRQFLLNKNQDLNKASDLGLMNKSGIDFYDMFQDRIMFPIFDMQGNLAGYTARAYLKDEKNKYINSKETIIYKKSNILFNYYMAKDAARLNKEIIIVEGNMDAISMASHGIKNVIALMGVVISPFQIEAIKRLNAKVILMLDSDGAGSLATQKIGEDIYNAGLDTYVVRLSGAKDPDEYINKFGVSSLEDNIKHAQKYLDFKINLLKDNLDLNNSIDITKYIKSVLDALGNASELEREITISKLCNDYHVDRSILEKELKPLPVKEEKEKVVIVKQKKTKYQMAVEEMLYTMLLDKNFYQIYLNNLGYLMNKTERDLVNLIGSYINKFGTIDIAGFIDYVIEYEKVSEYLNDILMSSEKENVTETEFYGILRTVSNCINEEEIKKLKEKIKNEQDVNQKIKLVEELTELKKGCGNNEGNKNI